MTRPAKVIPIDEGALRVVGRRIDEAWENERASWVDKSLALMEALREGRERFPSDRAFGAWLTESGHDHWKKDARAALIGLAADPLQARELLTKTDRRSYELIWREEKRRFRNAPIPAKPRRPRLAENSATSGLTAAGKLTVEKAVRIEKARLAKEFEAAVSKEVHRRIAAADEEMRKQNKELRHENLYLTGLISQRAVFSGVEFSRLMMCTHPDNSASAAVRNEMQALLIANKRRLVKQEQR